MKNENNEIPDELFKEFNKLGDLMTKIGDRNLSLFLHCLESTALIRLNKMVSCALLCQLEYNTCSDDEVRH